MTIPRQASVLIKVRRSSGALLGHIGHSTSRPSATSRAEADMADATEVSWVLFFLAVMSSSVAYSFATE